MYSESERIQTHKITYFIISFIWNSQKDKTRVMENRSVAARNEGEVVTTEG